MTLELTVFYDAEDVGEYLGETPVLFPISERDLWMCDNCQGRGVSDRWTCKYCNETGVCHPDLGAPPIYPSDKSLPYLRVEGRTAGAFLDAHGGNVRFARLFQTTASGLMDTARRLREGKDSQFPESVYGGYEARLSLARGLERIAGYAIKVGEEGALDMVTLLIREVG